MRVGKTRMKKGISLVLAATMALSACAVGFTAFAEDRDLSTVTKIEAAIKEDTLDDKGNETNTQLLENDLKVAFDKLGSDQKDLLTPLAIAKIYKMAYNSATGNAQAKAEAAVVALGAYTPKVQAGIDFAKIAAGITQVPVGGVNYFAKLSYFTFTAPVTTGGVTYSIDEQKAITVKVAEMYKAMDAYSLEIADCFYSTATYTYSMGGYQFSATTPLFTTMAKYADLIGAVGKTAAEKQVFIFDTLGLSTGATGYKKALYDTIMEYTSAKHLDAAKAFASSSKDQAAKDSFKAITSDAFNKTVYSYSLESKITNLTSKIVAFGDAMTSVNAIWSQVTKEYQPILDDEAIAPVIAKILATNLSNVKTSADATKVFVDAGYGNNLSYAQKVLVTSSTQLVDVIAQLKKISNDADTKVFRDSVTNYNMPASVTPDNKVQVAADSAQFVKDYKALKSGFTTIITTSNADLQKFIKADYPAVDTKYLRIVDLGKDATIADFVDAIKKFDLNATPSSELNDQIAALKTTYTGFATDIKTYLLANHAEVSKKFNDIIALWYAPAGENTHIAPTEVTVGSDSQITTVITETVVKSLGTIVNELLAQVLVPGAKDLGDALSSVYTNETVTMAVKLIGPMLYDLIAGLNVEVLGMKLEALFGFSPEGLSTVLAGIPQFDKINVASKLAVYGESPTDFAKVPDDFDWGVVDGDYDTFITAILAGVGRLLNTGIAGTLIVTMWTTQMIVGSYEALPDKSGIDMSSVKLGGYNSFIIPLLEALGATDLPTGLEYAMMVNDEEGKKASGSADVNKSGSAMLDSILRPVVDIAFDQILSPLAKDPGKYLLENLPNMIYHLQDGCIFNNLMDTLSANPIPLADINVGDILKDALGGDLSLELIFNLLSPTLSGLGINLKLEDITAIAGMGKATSVDTAKDVDKTIKIVADTNSVANYIGNAVGSLLNAKVTGTFVKVEVPAYPHDGKMNKEVMNKLITNLDETILGFVNLADVINGALATQEMAGTAIEAIYKAINGLLGNETIASLGINLEISPKMVADAMPEKKYDDLRAYLKSEAITSWDLVDFTLKNDDGELIKQVNMGFKNGNMKDFIDCIVASIRPLVAVLQETTLLTNKTVDGKVVYGLYETLVIPVLEAIGLTPAATSETYTKNYNSMALSSETEATDYLVKTILNPVIGLLEKLEAAPLATIMNLLPTVAYALKYDSATAFIGNLLLGDKNLADVINPLLDGLLKGVLPENSTDKLVLNPINFDALISAGTIKTDKKSMSALRKTYTTVVPDKADVLVTSFYYLFDTINTGDNLKTVKNLLGSLEMDATLKATLDSVVGTIFDMTREEGLCFIGGMFADWTCPNEAGDEDGKGTNGKTPGTGDMAIASIAVVSVLFAAGVAIVLLRKKKTIAE